MEPMDEDDFFHLKLVLQKRFAPVFVCEAMSDSWLLHTSCTQYSFQQIAATFQEWVR